MRIDWQYEEEKAERAYIHRIWLEEQEALDAKEAADAIDYDAIGSVAEINAHTARIRQARLDMIAELDAIGNTSIENTSKEAA